MAQQTQTATPQTASVQMRPAGQPATSPVIQQSATPAKPVEETSVLKKWWFWVILVIVGLLIGAGIYFLI